MFLIIALPSVDQIINSLFVNSIFVCMFILYGSHRPRSDLKKSVLITLIKLSSLTISSHLILVVVDVNCGVKHVSNVCH